MESVIITHRFCPSVEARADTASSAVGPAELFFKPGYSHGYTI